MRVLLLRAVARGAELGDVETRSGVYPWSGQGMGLAAAYRELLSYRRCCGALDMRWGAMGAITNRATAATGAVAVAVWSTT